MCSTRCLLKKKAFTLLESSIVLAIIGLVVGGIVVGQSLIHSAEIKTQIAQLKSYHSAFFAFQEKYNCLPGDCPNATSFFGTVDDLGNTINNGDGNGFIDTSDKLSYDLHAWNHAWASQTEMWGAFQQLALAQLIDFKPSNPQSSLSGVGLPILKATNQASFFIGASYNFEGSRNPDVFPSLETGNNALWIIACNNATNNVVGYWDDNCGIFTAVVLQAIDAKIDDGIPLTGNILGFGGWNSNNDCLVPDGSSYKTTGVGLQCQAAYLLN